MVDYLMMKCAVLFNLNVLLKNGPTFNIQMRNGKLYNKFWIPKLYNGYITSNSTSNILILDTSIYEYMQCWYLKLVILFIY